MRLQVPLTDDKGTDVKTAPHSAWSAALTHTHPYSWENALRPPPFSPPVLRQGHVSQAPHVRRVERAELGEHWMNQHEEEEVSGMVGPSLEPELGGSTS